MQKLLLVTEPTSGLLSAISARWPDWRVEKIGQSLPDALPTGSQAWAFVNWLCPGISGLELCRRLRAGEATRQVHITMVLDDSDPETCRRALQAGADDYMVGPLDADRVSERVTALPVCAAPPRQRHVHGSIMVDMAAHQVRVAGTLVPLRPNEFHLLVHFIDNPDQVFSREALITRLGKHARGIDERTVDVWVGRLGRALVAAGAVDPLRTVRSLGYVMDTPG